MAADRAIAAPDSALESIFVLRSASFAPAVDRVIASAGLSSRYFRSSRALLAAAAGQPLPFVLSHWNGASRNSFSLLRGLRRLDPSALAVVLGPSERRDDFPRAYQAGAAICVDGEDKLLSALGRARDLRSRLAAYDEALSRFRSLHRNLCLLASSCPDPGEVVSSFLRVIRPVVPYDAALVLVREGDIFQLAGSAGAAGLLESGEVVDVSPAAAGFISNLISEGEPSVLQDASIMRGSLLAVPLFSPPGLEGIVLFINEQPAERDAAEISSAAAFASRLAAAMGNVLHYRDLAQQARKLAALLETRAELSCAQEVQAMLELAVSEAARLTKSKICTIRLIEGEYLSVGVACGYKFPESRRHRIRIDERLRCIIHDHQPLAIPDLMADPELPASRRERAERETVRSFLGVPMTFEEETLGIFSLYKAGVHHWSEEEISLAAAMAGRTAHEITDWRSHRAIPPRCR